jgi:HD superfamily phosphohydrolase
MSSLFHVIKDPVHGAMQFTHTEDKWVKPFIDSPHFQRLRHIKQLGMGDLIFPGATHTRFNHSLGCCYVASQIAQKIGLVEEERQLVMIACLLHDLGHGPFSHAFEGVFKQKRLHHEDWTDRFLAEYGTPDFFEHYNRLNPRYHLTEEKFREIANMIMHRPVHKQVLADIVSSQLDADRLDYLLRDSHFCGVRYGEYDLSWMLHCMTIIASPEGERLGITHKGMGVVEHYVMARRLMVRNIYHGHKKLAIEQLLVQLLASLAESLETYEPYASIRKSRLGQLLIAVNQFNQKEVVTAAEKKLFIEQNYANYKELCDDDAFLLIRHLADKVDAHPASHIASRIKYRHMPKIVHVEHHDWQQVVHEIQDFKARHAKQYQDWQITLIQTPHQAYRGDENPILVVNEESQVRSIDQFSFMINAISDKLEHTALISIDKMIAEEKPVLALMQHFQGEGVQEAQIL